MIKNGIYIIAEAGINHNGSVSLAKKLIDIAIRAGANAVKFQTFRTERLVTTKMPNTICQNENQPKISKQIKLLRSLELSEADHRKLFSYCKEKQIEFVSTPFDIDSLEFLVRLGVKKIKISSGEITNGPLLLAAARTQLPVILSTGMSTLSEIEDALAVLAFGYQFPELEKPHFVNARSKLRNSYGRNILKKKVSLLHCTTQYPPPYDEINLRAMVTMFHKFGLTVGLSDHSPGTAISVAAIPLGASIIEKHFTISRKMKGPDQAVSLEPEELCDLVRSIRNVEKALGNGKKVPVPSEKPNIKIARKSIVAERNIAKGEIFSQANISCKRPGRGMSPMRFWDLLGKTSNQNYEKDDFVRVGK